MKIFAFNLIILPLISSLSGCLHNYSPYSDFPLQLDIRAIKKADSILFQLKNRYETLDSFYVKSARVERSREVCDEPMQSASQLKWHLFFNKKSIPATQGVLLKKGNVTLKRNTLYLVKLMISKEDGSRQGFGTGVFVLSSNGKLLTASSYPEIQKLCAQGEIK